jgi:hypothetical protein
MQRMQTQTPKQKNSPKNSGSKLKQNVLTYCAASDNMHAQSTDAASMFNLQLDQRADSSSSLGSMARKH